MKPELEKKFEFKVGFFVLIGLTLTLVSIIILGGKQSVFSSVNHYYTHFPKVDGLVGGAKVVLGGLQIGHVRSVKFDSKTRDIKVEYSIEEEYGEWIRRDTTIEIVTQGVLGDKYLSINAGDPSQELVPENSEIPMGVSKDLSQLFSSSEALMLKLTSTAENLDRILSNFNKNNRSDQFFNGLASTAQNMSEISQKLNNELNQVKIKSSIQHLNSILEKIDHGQGSVGALINDPILYDDLKALVGQVNKNRIYRNLIRQTIKENKEDSNEP